jgi:hypothetical protein
MCSPRLLGLKIVHLDLFANWSERLTNTNIIISAMALLIK